MKLYLVKLRGMSVGGHKESYVVANEPSEAYKTVRKFLDEKKWGFDDDRELLSVELLAESISSTMYPACKKTLFFAEGVEP